jgi:hypothetical protein
LYLPRHYKVDRRKTTNLKPFLLVVLIIALSAFVYNKKKEILFIFSGNLSQKYSKIEKKIINNMMQGKVDKDLIVDFLETSAMFSQSEPINPVSYHGLAKGAYYELLLKNFQFTIKNLIKYVSNNKQIEETNDETYQIIDRIYRNALKANTVQENFNEKDSNLLLIALCETMEARKKPSLILQNLLKIKYDNLSIELKSLYIWLNFITTVNSGDTLALEAIYDINNKLDSRLQIQISERELLLLMGIANFHKKEYVQALQNFREVKENLDYLTVEAIKFEANIFFIQNLHEKAIFLLEDLYIKLNREDDSIKEQIKQIVNSKSGLKSKILGQDN